MLGRGIDRFLPHPSSPALHERYVRNTIQYVELAEARSGSLSIPVPFSYVWGDALKEFDTFKPDVKLINLETSITTSNTYAIGKGIHYRMHPDNISCLTAAKIDCCALANNHVLDWGRSGLLETLSTLKRGSIQFAGAGHNIREAEAPAEIVIGDHQRLLVFSYGSESSGVPPSWRATATKPGIAVINDYSDRTVRTIQDSIETYKQPGDIAVISIHWGGNWGYEIPEARIRFARKLIRDARVDLIHGHSCHHVQGCEVYQNKLILYGCGDFIDDYEGIGGYQRYRADVGLMYFASLDVATGKLLTLQMVPTQINRFKVNRAQELESAWLQKTLNREGHAFGTRVELAANKTLELRWT